MSKEDGKTKWYLRPISVIGGSSSTKEVPEGIRINQPLFELLSRLGGEKGLQKVVGPYVFQKINGKPYGTIKTTWKTCS